MAFQEAVRRYDTSERRLIDQYPEVLVEANIRCADGFSAPVAINRANMGNTELSVSGQVELLHEKFHQAAGHERCTGACYSWH